MGDKLHKTSGMTITKAGPKSRAGGKKVGAKVHTGPTLNQRITADRIDESQFRKEQKALAIERSLERPRRIAEIARELPFTRGLFDLPIAQRMALAVIDAYANTVVMTGQSRREEAVKIARRNLDVYDRRNKRQVAAGIDFANTALDIALREIADADEVVKTSQPA